MKPTKLAMVLATVSVIALTGFDASAQSRSRTAIDTDVNTGVSTMQNSGVVAGTGTRINGGIRTGSNTALTDVNTDIGTSATTINGGRRAARSSTSIGTGVNTGVDTMQNSGVVLGDGTRINGGIRTGSNYSKANVDTNIDTSARTINGRRTSFGLGSRTSANADFDRGYDSDTPWQSGKGKKLGHVKAKGKMKGHAKAD